MSTEDMAGGEWEQLARHLYVESDGWIRGHYVPTAIHTVRNYAKLADSLGNRGALDQLHRALSKLEREIEMYGHRMDALYKEVGHLHSIVLRARDEAPELTKDQVEEQRRWALVEESGRGIDDDVIRRAAELHKPKP